MQSSLPLQSAVNMFKGGLITATYSKVTLSAADMLRNKIEYQTTVCSQMFKKVWAFLPLVKGSASAQDMVAYLSRRTTLLPVLPPEFPGSQEMSSSSVPALLSLLTQRSALWYTVNIFSSCKYALHWLNVFSTDIITTDLWLFRTWTTF